MNTAIENFRLKAYSLGNEIDIIWNYVDINGNNILSPQYQLYLFKRSSKDITNDEILTYIQSPKFENLARGLYVFLDISNFERERRDFKVERDHIYYYKAVIVNRNDRQDVSDIVSATLTNPDFIADINVVDSKEYVLEGLKKIMSAVAKYMNADISVYNDFPMETLDNAFVVATRASGETIYRFWSDIISQNKDITITGELDKDIIQVVWECTNSPSTRDKLTNIFRGSRRALKRFLLNQQGIKDVQIILTGDGVDARVSGEHLVYGSMIIELTIENSLIASRGIDSFDNIEHLFIIKN